MKYYVYRSVIPAVIDATSASAASARTSQVPEREQNSDEGL